MVFAPRQLEVWLGSADGRTNLTDSRGHPLTDPQTGKVPTDPDDKGEPAVLGVGNGASLGVGNGNLLAIGRGAIGCSALG